MTLFKEIYDRQVLPEDMQTWERWLDEIEQFALTAQAYHLLKEEGWFHGIPENAQHRLKEGAERTLVQNLFVKREGEELVRKLDHKGIEVIPLKGTWFAERFFGHFAARITSDIDLLVHDHDVEYVIECLRSMGFSGPHDFNPFHFHCVLTKQLPRISIPLIVEVHWNLVQDRTSSVDLAELWRHAIPISQFKHVRELSTQHVFYALCLHGANHHMDSPKYVLDIAQMLYRYGDDVDYPSLFRQASRDKTRSRVVAVLSYVYKQFPQLNGVKPLPRKMVTKTSTYVQSDKFNILLVDSWVHRFRLVWHWMVPPLDVVRWHVQREGNQTAIRLYLLFYSERVRKFTSKLRKLELEKFDGE